MKVYIVTDSYCSVYGVYRNFDDAARKFEEIADRLHKEPECHNIGRSKYHLWWENDCYEQRDLCLKERELM